MPNIKSAEKRVSVNEKKNLENRTQRSRMNSAVRKFNRMLDANEQQAAAEFLPQVFSIIDSLVSKGIIHKNNASNKKSGLSKRLSDIASGKVVVAIKKDNRTIAAEKAKAAQEQRDVARNEAVKRRAEKQAAKIAAEKAKLEEEKKAKKEKKAKPASGKAEKPEKADKKAKAEKADK